MTRLSIPSSEVFEEEHVTAVADSVREGGIALLPTDTVYGLAVRPDLSASVQRLFAMKRRPVTRNLPVMVSDRAQIDALGFDVNDPATRVLSSKFVPGPITVAMGLHADRASWLEGRVEAAVRIPDHAFLRRLLKTTGPLLMTSANLSAQQVEEDVNGIVNQLGEMPDVIVDGGRLSVVPSTLVNCRLVPPVVEREGVVAAEDVESLFR